MDGRQATDNVAFAVISTETTSSSQRTIRRYEASLVCENPFAPSRVSLGLAPEKAPFFSVVDELTDLSPEFRRLWADHEVSSPGEGATHFRSPRHGDQHFRHHLLMPEAWPALRIVVFIPGPAPSDPSV